MSRELDSGFINQLSQDTIYPFFTVSLQFQSGEVNLWTGEKNLNVGGTSYVGTGSLLNISEIEETTEMAVRGATLSLSGMDASVISLALSEPYQGRPCSIGFGVFNGFSAVGALLTENVTESFLLKEDDGLILLEGDLFHTEIFAGYMDTMDITEAADSSTIKLSVVNKLVDLERSRSIRYNSAAQKLIYPEDKGLDFVESIADQELFWGIGDPRRF